MNNQQLSSLIRENKKDQVKQILRDCRYKFYETGTEPVKRIDLVLAVMTAVESNNYDCLEYLFNDFEDRITAGRQSLTEEDVIYLFDRYSREGMNYRFCAKILCFEGLFIDKLRGNIPDVQNQIFQKSFQRLPNMSDEDQESLKQYIAQELNRYKIADDEAYRIGQRTIAEVHNFVEDKNVATVIAEYLPLIDYVNQATDNLTPSPSPAPQEYSKLQQDRCCVIA